MKKIYERPSIYVADMIYDKDTLQVIGISGDDTMSNEANFDEEENTPDETNLSFWND